MTDVLTAVAEMCRTIRLSITSWARTLRFCLIVVVLTGAVLLTQAQPW